MSGHDGPRKRSGHDGLRKRSGHDGLGKSARPPSRIHLRAAWKCRPAAAWKCRPAAAWKCRPAAAWKCRPAAAWKCGPSGSPREVWHGRLAAPDGNLVEITISQKESPWAARRHGSHWGTGNRRSRKRARGRRRALLLLAEWMYVARASPKPEKGDPESRLILRHPSSSRNVHLPCRPHRRCRLPRASSSALRNRLHSAAPAGAAARQR